MNIFASKNVKSLSDDEKRRNILALACVSGALVSYQNGVISIAGTLSNGTKYPPTVGIYLREGNYPDKEYFPHMKNLMRFANHFRNLYIDEKKSGEYVSSPFEVSASDDPKEVANMQDPFQFAYDIMQDTSGIIRRKTVQNQILSQVKNAREATEKAPWGKGVNRTLESYLGGREYLLEQSSEREKV